MKLLQPAGQPCWSRASFRLQNSFEVQIRRWGTLYRGRHRVRQEGMNFARTFLCSELCGQLGIQLMTASSRASSAGSSFHASEKKEKIPIPLSRKSSSCLNTSSLNAQLAGCKTSYWTAGRTFGCTAGYAGASCEDGHRWPHSCKASCSASRKACRLGFTPHTSIVNKEAAGRKAPRSRPWSRFCLPIFSRIAYNSPKIILKYHT